LLIAVDDDTYERGFGNFGWSVRTPYQSLVTCLHTDT